MDETLAVNDPQVLLALLGCAFVLVLAWIMNGIARLEAPAPENGDRAAGFAAADPALPQVFDAPERCTQPIGRYMDAPIFESVFIGGAEYRYDRVLPPRATWAPARGERCIAPGIVYVRR
jgi:hypothetical protein